MNLNLILTICYYLRFKKVKKKQHERRSQPKEVTPLSVGNASTYEESSTHSHMLSTRNTSRNSSVVHNDKEELDFNFDEDMDIPQGRQNKFSSVYV